MSQRFASILSVFCLVAAIPVSAQVHRGGPMAADTVSWIRQGAIYEVFVRDFSPGGDLRGVLAGLDRIQAVGANIVWLMPIYPVGVKDHKGTLGSPYSVQDYHGINPAFGTAADLHALVDAAHARGMRIILDWVPNHTARDNVWVTEHPDFYVRDAQGNLVTPRDDKGNPTDWTDVAQLDYKKPKLRAAMIEAMRWWITTFGIDGYRVDAAGFVPDAFWKEAVPAVRAAVKRPILLLAEWGDLKMHTFGFDLTYPWDAYSHLKATWGGQPAWAFVNGELADAKAMPAGGERLRFTTNHDETAWDKPPVTLFGGSAGARAAYVAMTLLPGRPLIYNGQDVESPQVLALFEQDSVRWGQPRANRTREFYRSVIALSRWNPDFIAGALQPLATSDSADVIAYRRGSAAVLVNARNHEVQFTVTGFNPDGATNLLTGTQLTGATVTLPAWGSLVLVRRPD